jgi:hypothetical protein
MSENEGQGSSQPESKESAAAGLLATVAELVKGSNSQVQKRYIDTLVEKEVSGRVDMLDKAMQKRFQCLTELNKVNRPDIEAFNPDGSLAHGHFSKERLKAIKDGKEALAKIEQAIEKALVGNDWSKLKGG